MIARRVAQIRERIGAAAERAGREASEIRIVAAAKTQPPDKIAAVVQAGVRLIGHNYVQEAAAMTEIDRKAVEIHMIGHLQKNKAGKAVELFDTIETVDSTDLVDALERRADNVNSTVGVLIQVNLALEPQKAGVTREEVERLAEHIRAGDRLKLKGLMTMPPFFDDPDRARPYFAALRELRDSLTDRGVLTPAMRELSMGMTGDFEVAVEEGATLVRIGTALFGPRAPK